MSINPPKITATCDCCGYSIDFIVNDYIDENDIIEELIELEWVVLRKDGLFFCSDGCFEDKRYEI
jgi:hypothetical protein